jgi:hypothetical protein
MACDAVVIDNNIIAGNNFTVPDFAYHCLACNAAIDPD